MQSRPVGLPQEKDIDVARSVVVPCGERAEDERELHALAGQRDPKLLADADGPREHLPEASIERMRRRHRPHPEVADALAID